MTVHVSAQMTVHVTALTHQLHTAMPLITHTQTCVDGTFITGCSKSKDANRHLSMKRCVPTDIASAITHVPQLLLRPWCIITGSSCAPGSSCDHAFFECPSRLKIHRALCLP